MPEYEVSFSVIATVEADDEDQAEMEALTQMPVGWELSDVLVLDVAPLEEATDAPTE